MVSFNSPATGADDDDDAMDLLSDDVMSRCPDKFDGEFFRLIN